MNVASWTRRSAPSSRLRDAGDGPRVAAQHHAPARTAGLRDLPADRRDRVVGRDRGEAEAGQLDRVAGLDRVEMGEETGARRGADRAPDTARRREAVDGQRHVALAGLGAAEEGRQPGDVVRMPVGEHDGGQLGELARAERELPGRVRAAVDQHPALAAADELGRRVRAPRDRRGGRAEKGDAELRGGRHLAGNCTSGGLIPLLSPGGLMPVMKRMPTLLLLAAAGAALALVAAGCGGKKSSGVASLGPGTVAAATQPTSTTVTRQDFQTAILAYTKCLRGEGVKIADPTFNGGGPAGAAAEASSARAASTATTPSSRRRRRSAGRSWPRCGRSSARPTARSSRTPRSSSRSACARTASTSPTRTSPGRRAGRGRRRPLRRQQDQPERPEGADGVPDLPERSSRPGSRRRRADARAASGRPAELPGP